MIDLIKPLIGSQLNLRNVWWHRPDLADRAINDMMGFIREDRFDTGRPATHAEIALEARRSVYSELVTAHLLDGLGLEPYWMGDEGVSFKGPFDIMTVNDGLIDVKIAKKQGTSTVSLMQSELDAIRIDPTYANVIHVRYGLTADPYLIELTHVYYAATQPWRPSHSNDRLPYHKRTHFVYFNEINDKHPEHLGRQG